MRQEEIYVRQSKITNILDPLRANLDIVLAPCNGTTMESLHVYNGAFERQIVHSRIA